MIKRTTFLPCRSNDETHHICTLSCTPFLLGTLSSASFATSFTRPMTEVGVRVYLSVQRNCQIDMQFEKNGRAVNLFLSSGYW